MLAALPRIETRRALRCPAIRAQIGRASKPEYLALALRLFDDSKSSSAAKGSSMASASA